MLRKAEKLQFHLQAEEIDRFSAWLDEGLKKARASRKNRLRFRLSAEEILLRLWEKFGEDALVEVSLERVIRKTRLTMEIRGEAFNPLRESADRMGAWNSSLLPSVGLEPGYAYNWGKNVIRLFLPADPVNPLIPIAAAIAAGCLLGFVGKALLSPQTAETLTSALFSPLYDVWTRILNALSGPVIFFTAITTLLNTDQIKKQGGSRKYVLGRYFLFSLLSAGFALLCTLPFYSVREVGVRLQWENVRAELETILGLIPGNVLEPFATSNTPQLLLLAFTAGAALTVLGKRGSGLRSGIRQVNMAGLLLARWVSLLVPVFTGVFLIFEIWNGNADAFRLLWQPILLFLIVTALILLAGVLGLAAVRRTSPLAILKICLPAFWTSLKTGSLDVSMEETERVCTKGFSVDPRFTEISLPQGAVLYMPVSSVSVLIFTVYAAVMYHTSVDPLQYLFIVLLVVILFVATPPVPGANLLAYAVLFSWIGIPDAALVNAMVFDIISGIVANAGNMALLQIETVIQAKHMGVLETDGGTDGRRSQK